MAESTPDQGVTFAAALQRVAQFEHRADRPPCNIRLAVLRDYSADQLAPLLKYDSIVEGLSPEVWVGVYDAIADDLLNATSPIRTNPPDLLIVTMHAPLDEFLSSAFAERRGSKVTAILGALENYLAATPALALVSTLAAPDFSPDGVACPGVESAQGQLEAINRRITEFAARYPRRVFVFDINRQIRRLGAERAFDARGEMRFGAPYRMDLLRAFSSEAMRIVFALKGRSRKCVVLDCDNTLWGGIIGEDGLDGIVLDAGTYPGCAYHQFQRALARLQERGILLALCSKNDEAAVFEVFDRHPHAALKRHHFAAWQINWERKSANLAAIAAKLNIGLDALIFVDDNPAEIAEVNAALPEVLTRLVPEGALHRLPTMLFQLPQLDQLEVSQEDRQRTEFFRQEADRSRVRAEFASEMDYLRALEISATIRPASLDQVGRLAQLSQKTNQFNLTTRRYSDAEIRALLAEPDATIISLSARDRFGYYGLTGLIVARRQDDDGIIEACLMSCRVLSRRLEIAMVRSTLEILSPRWTARRWRAHYAPTRKNALAASFWETAGFTEVSRTEAAVHYERAEISEGWNDTSFIAVNHE